MKFMIPIIVGAVIGYITNWLAIKMLFRPYEKKYIFGIAVPFTPGLIPKEQRRIAKSVGDTVGAYLLSEDVIMEKVKNIDLETSLNKILSSEYESLVGRHISLEEIFNYFDFESEPRKLAFSKDISKLIFEKLKEEDSLKKLGELSDEIIDGLDSNEGAERIRNMILEYIVSLGEDKKLEGKLGDLLLETKRKLESDERYLREIVEEDRIKELVSDNSDILVEIIKDCIDDFTIADRVKDLLNKIIEKNMSRTIRMFLAPDTISEKIYRILEDFIYSEDFKLKIKPILTSLVDRVMDYRVEDLILKFEKELDHNFIDKISSFIANDIILNKKEDISIIVRDEIILNEKIIKNKFRDYILRSYSSLIEKDEFREFIFHIIYNNMESLFSGNIVDLILKIDRKHIDRMVIGISQVMVKLINENLPSLIKLFNISEIVEDEINKFEVDFAEEVILEIASKELKAITWLGALLGAIMGILSPILQMI